MDAGEAIKAARIARGLSQLELARRTGMTKRAVSYWETDRRDPTATSLQRIADALEIDFLISTEGVGIRLREGFFARAAV